ncbi:hypothetical protein L873DRAFT_1826418 [Choiromyces venosus 120613-1]|uniref:Zn(2)-C6 fungal-type domain-containing protein n=1 Tax=Choiromyces venosus 120613-1 TaxID=1336337 RepID=A0A3N4K3S3_9PEZI|nr:hypothetical protein L873DRAFT_1826418 [Choiromyces venosus 120613-1]
MEIDPNLTDASGHSDTAGHHHHRGQFTPSSHSLPPPLATGPHDPPPHSQASGAAAASHPLDYSQQPAHLTPVRSAASLSASPTTAAAAAASLQQLQEQKRPRACESCRGLKVRCEPNAENPSKKCKRCAKANRECIFTAPSRKRQKKADTKVAELEKKIDALTASLNATKQRAARASPGEDEDDEEDYEDETLTEAVVVEAAAASTSPVSARPAAKRRKGSGGGGGGDDNQAQQRLRNDAEKYAALYPFLAPKGSKIPVSTHIKPAEGNGHQYEYLDVIDRQLLGMEMARKIFDHYVEDLAPHFPAVVFPPGTIADKVRAKSPTLFLAILASASGTSHPDLHRALHKEISRALADKIMINGEKSLEIVQALLVTTVWYYPPEHFEELKFYMLIHQAAVMALEIGLGRKTVLSKSRAPGTCTIPGAMRPGEDIGPRGMPHGPWIPGPGGTYPPPGDRKYGFPNPLPVPVPRVPYPDSSTLESRRTLLACYWTCCNVSMALRRPNMLRFTPFMEECVRELESNPLAEKTDISLANWVKMQKIAEDVGNEFAFDQVDAVVSLQEERVQLKLQEFNARLKAWKEELPEEAKHPHLEMAYHILSIYTNEIVLHNNHNIDDFRPPYTESSLRLSPSSTQPLTPLHFNAISTCISSAHAVLQIFFSLPLTSARSIPMFSFVRCSYACVVLLKIYFTASSPKSELGKHLDRNSLEITQYLERLTGKLEEVAADDKCRGAGKFVMIIMMLRTWYFRQSAEVERSLGTPVEPAASLSRLGLGEAGGGEESAGITPGSAYPHSPSTLSSKSPPPPGTTPTLNPLHHISHTPSKYFPPQQPQEFQPLTPPQPQSTSYTPAPTAEWPAPPPEPLLFTGNGEMFTDDGFWALMDGNIAGFGMGMLNWGGGF